MIGACFQPPALIGGMPRCFPPGAGRATSITNMRQSMLTPYQAILLSSPPLACPPCSTKPCCCPPSMMIDSQLRAFARLIVSIVVVDRLTSFLSSFFPSTHHTGCGLPTLLHHPSAPPSLTLTRLATSVSPRPSSIKTPPVASSTTWPIVCCPGSPSHHQKT